MSQLKLKSPNDFIIEKDESYVILDDISNNLITLIEIQKENYNIQRQNQEILLQTQKLQKHILEELKAEADEGEVLRLNGTVTTTEFTIINTITDPNHPIKAFELTNDGPNSIYTGFNVVLSGEGADIIDVTNDISRFETVSTNEIVSYDFNRRKIRNIYLLASGGNSSYRLKLTW